jgi:hypothetical protein
MSNELFSIVDGKKSDRYVHWETILDEKPDVIEKIKSIKDDKEQLALIKKEVDKELR